MKGKSPVICSLQSAEPLQDHSKYTAVIYEPWAIIDICYHEVTRVVFLESSFIHVFNLQLPLTVLYGNWSVAAGVRPLQRRR